MDKDITVEKLQILASTERYEKALNAFKPAITHKIDDGSWRRIIRFPLGISGNEVKLVEIKGVEGNLDSSTAPSRPIVDVLAEMLLEVNFLNPKDPKHKTNPVVKMDIFDTAKDYLVNLGDAESFPLGVAFLWLQQSQGLFQPPGDGRATASTPVDPT